MSLTESVFLRNLYSAEGQFSLCRCQDLPLSHLPGPCGEMMLSQGVGEGHLVSGVRVGLSSSETGFGGDRPASSGLWSLAHGNVTCCTMLCLWLTKLYCALKNWLSVNLISRVLIHTHSQIEGYKETLEVLFLLPWLQWSCSTCVCIHPNSSNYIRKVCAGICISTVPQ